jgi:YVTN family beta-propeller protein
VTIHDIANSSYRELDRISLESNAYWITFSPDGRWAFVALSQAGSVAVIDTASRRVSDQLSAGAGPKRNLVVDLDQVAGGGPDAARY